MKNDNKDFVKIFDTIRFSDDALDTGVSPVSRVEYQSDRDDTTTYCFDDTTSCSLNKTSCSYKNDSLGSSCDSTDYQTRRSDPSKDSSCLNRDDTTSCSVDNGTSSIKPEEISFWINFGYFRK